MKPFAIDSPCSENWKTMRVEAGGRARHCASCDKHVFDLAQLSEAQIRGVVALHPGGFCGRQTLRDGELVTAPEPVALRSRWPLRLGLGGALVSGALATAACEPAAAAPGPFASIPQLLAGAPRPDEPSQPATPETPLAPPRPEPLQVMAGGIAPPRPSLDSAEVSFAPGSAKLSKSELAQLDDIAAALKVSPWLSLAVEGHVAADEVADKRAAKLALARARAVHSALVKRGVAASRLELLAGAASSAVVQLRVGN